MELLRGINLLQLVDLDGPLPPARVVHLLRQACGALAEAHAAGLIHRDIKPANLMVCLYGGIPDFLKVLDFGLVKDVGAVEPLPRGVATESSGDAALSQDGSLLGTPLYMAPEGMSDPTHVDARADVFALGAVGYFLLTGKSPFVGRTAIEVFRMERQGPPPPLSETARHPVPPSLDRVICCCLSFRREDRPGSAEALDAMLEKCVEERGRARLVAGEGAGRARCRSSAAGGAGPGAERGSRFPGERIARIAGAIECAQTNARSDMLTVDGAFDRISAVLQDKGYALKEEEKAADSSGDRQSVFASPNMSVRVCWDAKARLLVLQVDAEEGWADFARHGFGPKGLEDSAVDALVRAVGNEVGETSTDSD